EDAVVPVTDPVDRRQGREGPDVPGFALRRVARFEAYPAGRIAFHTRISRPFHDLPLMIAVDRDHPARVVLDLRAVENQACEWAEMAGVGAGARECDFEGAIWRSCHEPAMVASRRRHGFDLDQLPGLAVIN